MGENTVGVNRRNEPEQMDGRLGILKLASGTERNRRSFLFA